MGPNALYWVVTFMVAAVTGFFLLRRLVRRGEAASRAALDRWADACVVEGIAERLREPAADALRALRGPPGASLAAAARAAFRSAGLTFTRSRGSPVVQVRLEVRFADGSSRSVTVTRTWDELPAPIRGEFLRGGHETVRRPWDCPRGEESLA